MNEETHEECGYVVVTVAILLTVLVGFMAFSVDSGFLYDSRTGAQSVVDAAALAGAFTFVTNPASPQPATAVQHATAVASDQTVMGDGVAAGDVTVAVDVANRRVTVDLDYAEETFFARALGFNTADIGVQAVAEAGDSATGTSCPKPWFFPNTILSSHEPCVACGIEADADGEFVSAPEVLFAADGSLTAFARARIGQDFVVKPGNPQDAVAPGVFAAIRLPGNSGGNDYREDIEGCSGTLVKCSEVYGLEPGNMIGPTSQGVRNLTGNPPDDTWVGPGAYLVNGAGPFTTSKALVSVPVWDACNFNEPGFCPGSRFPSGATTQLQVIGFATLFLDGIQGNDVNVHFVDGTACESGISADDVSSEAAPFAVPLRLVRTPPMEQ